MSNTIDTSGAGNAPHMHRIFGSGTELKSYQGVAGQVAFSICQGENYGALYHGNQCGPIGIWPMFPATTNFTNLYELLSAPVGEPITGDQLVSVVESLDTAQLTAFAKAILSALPTNNLKIETATGGIFSNDAVSVGMTSAPY